MDIVLKLVPAIAIDGKIARAGEIVEVSESVARSLLHRGKAVLAVQDAPLNDEVIDVVESEEPPAEAPKAKRGKRGS